MYTALILFILAGSIICLGGIYYKRSIVLGILVPGAMLLIIIAFLSTAVLPYMEKIPATDKGVPYSERALLGRQIYVREGGWYCHTQQVRPIGRMQDWGRSPSLGTISTTTPTSWVQNAPGQTSPMWEASTRMSGTGII